MLVDQPAEGAHVRGRGAVAVVRRPRRGSRRRTAAPPRQSARCASSSSRAIRSSSESTAAWTCLRTRTSFLRLKRGGRIGAPSSRVGLLEEVRVVDRLAAVDVDDGHPPSPSRSADALPVVRGRRRHVSAEDEVERADVDAELERRAGDERVDRAAGSLECFSIASRRSAGTWAVCSSGSHHRKRSREQRDVVVVLGRVRSSTVPAQYVFVHAPLRRRAGMDAAADRADVSLALTNESDHARVDLVRAGAAGERLVVVRRRA